MCIYIYVDIKYTSRSGLVFENNFFFSRSEFLFERLLTLACGDWCGGGVGINGEVLRV